MGAEGRGGEPMRAVRAALPYIKGCRQVWQHFSELVLNGFVTGRPSVSAASVCVNGLPVLEEARFFWWA